LEYQASSLASSSLSCGVIVVDDVVLSLSAASTTMLASMTGRASLLTDDPPSSGVAGAGVLIGCCEGEGKGVTP
jgi:hypothetical protein